MIAKIFKASDLDYVETREFDEKSFYHFMKEIADAVGHNLIINFHASEYDVGITIYDDYFE